MKRILNYGTRRSDSEHNWFRFGGCERSISSGLSGKNRTKILLLSMAISRQCDAAEYNQLNYLSENRFIFMG